MTFSRGQNGKGDKSNQNGKLKKNGFFKQKTGDKNRKSPSFNKEKLTVQPSVKRNEYRIALKKERLTHHQVPRSPQKRLRIEAAEEVVPAEEVGLPHTISLVTEPLFSVSLVTEEVADAEPFAEPFPVAEPFSTVELISRESRSAKNNKKKRKNDGKNSPTFILKLYICFFIVILKSLYSETYCTFIYRLFLFSYNFSCQCGAYYFIAS